MKICFPARKKGGKDYTSVDEIMTQVLSEPHGCWLAGSNLLWHGGLHISTVTAPDSVLTAETVDTAVPLQFMAGGEVVAWRLNRDYLTSQYNGQRLQYSSTFVLVKSVCQPDPQDSKTWLEFYSLYMGLAPLSAFPAAACWRVTDRGGGLRKRVYSGAEKDGQKAPVPGRGLLKKGARVAIIKQAAFELDGESQPFGLAKVLNKKGEPAGAPFWVSLNPEYMKQEDTEYAHLPAWMQQAVKQGTFDEVVKPAAKTEVAAGDAVGFLAEDIDPVGMGKVETSHFAHIEVLSNDARLPAFLDNPGKITTGKQYIRLHSGKSLYQKNGTGEAGTFRAMSCVIVKDSGKILPVEKCNPLKDDQGKTWYEISPGNWMSESDVDVLHQYDLQALGFSALAEVQTADMSASLREGWMKSLLNRLSEMVDRDRGIQHQQVSDYYKKAVSNIDTDGDGELSAEELFYAVHHPEMEIRNIAARMVVKHDSEWFGGSSHHKWEVYFQDYDLLRMKYAKQWRDDMEWMSKVEGFEKGEPVWHMHPVIFLDALGDPKGLINIDAFISLYEKEHTSFAPMTVALSAASKSNLRKLLLSLNDFYSSNTEYKPNLYKLAYMLATTRHETYHYITAEFFSEKPEIGGVSYFNKYDPVLANTQKRKERAVKNGNTVQGDGFKYRGRGCVHLTWKNNYQKAQDKFGVNFVSTPDLAGDFKYAVPIMVWGMEEGMFSGKALTNYISSSDINYTGARYVINGQDQAPLIASYAKRFETILEKTSSAPQGF